MTPYMKHKNLKQPASSQVRERGFTLLELLITLVIAAIILTQGVPSFATMIKNNRLITQTNNLVADLNLARSEAITRGIPVIVCRTADPNVANECGGTWTSGWLVYVDDDGDSTFTPATDTLLRVGYPAGGSVTVAANATATPDVIFNSDGLTDEGGTATFAVCDDRGTSEGRQINVNVTGRIRTSTGPASC